MKQYLLKLKDRRDHSEVNLWQKHRLGFREFRVSESQVALCSNCKNEYHPRTSGGLDSRRAESACEGDEVQDLRLRGAYLESSRAYGV